MPSKQSHLFGEVDKTEYKHDDAQSLRDHMNKPLVFVGCDFEDLGDMKTTYLQVLDENQKPIWYYTTSKVVYEQVQKVQSNFSTGTITATCVKVKNYYKLV